MIGGHGADFLTGLNNDDILIAGSLQNIALANLNAIRTAWLSSASYNTRVNNLKSTLLRPDLDVFDDGIVDVLTGGNGRDWFMVNSDPGSTDIILDQANNETVTDVDVIV
jgi:Ca2+-binding RTX toxin-like protein